MGRLIFSNANILDGDHAPVRGTLVIAGERIETVSSAPVAARPDDRIIDLAGRTVMPGMILGHYHASYWNVGGGGAPLGLEVTPSHAAMRATANIRTTLECGFTGVISAGAPHAIDAALKAAIREGAIIGPHIMVGSRDVSSTGHSADMSYPSHWDIRARGNVHRCDGPDEFRRAIREEAKDGAEIIKIFATDGHATGGDGSGWCIDPDEFAAATRAAAARGVKTRAHIANREAILMALDLGVHIIDHGDGFDDACMDAILARDAFLTPSLMFPKAMMTIMPGNPYTDLMIEPYEAMAAILPKLNAAGVKLLLGDDYGAQGLPHGRYAEELALYVNEVGIPALDVIRWATKYGAEAMLIADRTGTLEPGKLADLIVIDGDPLADITLLQDRARILAILKEGQVVKDDLAHLGRTEGPSHASGAPSHQRPALS